MTEFNLKAMQQAIAQEEVDGWLLYDFQGSDPIARRILSIDAKTHITRRWFYYIPNHGTPLKLCHKIETWTLDHVPGGRKLYAGWKELRDGLVSILAGAKKVAMNYSPGNAIPYVSRVDAGTVEFVRECGVEVVTAADLIQQFEAVIDEDQVRTHIRATDILRKIVDETFTFIANNIRKGNIGE